MRPRPRVHFVVVERTRVTTSTPESPGIPRAMVLRFPSCSPRRSGSFATVTCGTYRKLDVRTTRLGRPQQQRPSRAPLRPPHPAPTSVTFANAPLSGTGCGRYRLICDFGKSEYFCDRGFTDFWVICPSGRFVESAQEIRLCAPSLCDENFCARRRRMPGSSPSGSRTHTGRSPFTVTRVPERVCGQ